MRLTSTSAADVAARLLAGVERTYGVCSTCGAVAVLFGSYGECAGCFADALGDWESREACTSEAIADLLTGGRSWDERRHQRWTRALHSFAHDVIHHERAMLAAETYTPVSSAARQAWIDGETRPTVLHAIDACATAGIDAAGAAWIDLAADATLDDWRAAQWTAAEREGWGLFDACGSAHGTPQIQAVDHDDERGAWRTVCDGAAAGQQHAVLALAIVAHDNPSELRRVLGAAREAARHE